MRPGEISARGDAADSIRHLHWRHRQRALADGYRDRLSRIPFLTIEFFLPGRRRHRAIFLIGKINAGFSAEAKLSGIIRHLIDAHVLAQIVEEYVAGMDNRLMHIHSAVPFMFPTIERAPVKA